jgi:non-ribosomal peptide synthetase component F
LPELPVQYGDYAVWQRQWLCGDVLEKQLEYWKRRLSGVESLVLPADRPRSSTLSTKGAMLAFEVPADISQDLATLGRQQGATLFMTLLAAYQVLLWRWSGQNDIAVGTPIAGRTHQQLEGLIGFLVNTLVLRSQIRGTATFQDLLKQVKDTALNAYAHQDLPFARLVAELQPTRSLTTQPLFQTMLTVQARAAGEPSFGPGLTCSSLDLGSKTATQFDLTLFVVEKAEGLTCEFEYLVELFDRSTIERMAGHFQTLLAGIVANPAAKLHELKILTPRERHQLLVEWNDTDMENPQERARTQVDRGAGRQDQMQ